MVVPLVVSFVRNLCLSSPAILPDQTLCVILCSMRPTVCCVKDKEHICMLFLRLAFMLNAYKVYYKYIAISISNSN